MWIRRADPCEVPRIEALVGRVIAETYGGLFGGAPPPVDGDFAQSVVALEDHAIVGVALTGAEWLDDLWVEAGHRGRGIGRALLAAAEAEIASRELTRARLRLVAMNVRARRFYAAQGWSEVRAYPHERFGFDIVELEKALTPQSTVAARARNGRTSPAH